MAIRILLLISILLSLTIAVAAQGETFDATLYQTVNIRSGPDARYDIVGQVSAGDIVLVTGRADDTSMWVRIEQADLTVGWVPSYLLIFDGEIAALPVLDRTVDSEAGEERIMVTAYGTVNVRTAPSIIGDIIAQLDAGDEAQALARSNERNDWLYVENATLSGWVAYFAVDVQGDPRTLPLRVPDVATDELVDPRELISTLFNVRLRGEPTLDGDEVGVLDFDTEVTAFARDDEGIWIFVGTEDLRGWAAAELFDIDAEQLEELPLYSADAEYELLDEDADAVPPLIPGPESTPFLAGPAAEATETPEAD